MINFFASHSSYFYAGCIWIPFLKSPLCVEVQSKACDLTGWLELCCSQVLWVFGFFFPIKCCYTLENESSLSFSALDVTCCYDSIKKDFGFLHGCVYWSSVLESLTLMSLHSICRDGIVISCSPSSFWTTQDL